MATWRAIQLLHKDTMKKMPNDTNTWYWDLFCFTGKRSRNMTTWRAVQLLQEDTKPQG
jgi:hypothetical protein